MREINDAMLRALKPPVTGRTELRDARVRGLVLRLTAAGVATWSIRIRTRDGRQTRPTLGTWPAMGVAEARRQALATTAAIQSGADPVTEKREARAARLERETAPTVIERLAQWRAAMEVRWSENYKYDIARFCRTEIEPKLGARVLAETKREDWTALVAAKTKKSASAGANLYRTCSSFLGHAEAHGWIPLPLLPRKGAMTIAPAVAPRERTLSDDELIAVWKAAEPESPRQRAFVRLLILTAGRRSEVADISTDEIDLDARRWRIPAARAKNNRALTVPLCPLALAELRAVWPNDPGNAGRLLGRGAAGLSGFSKLKERIDKASGVFDWGWHDLRRSVRSGMARLGVPREAAEAALNHISGRSALDRTYDRHDYAPEVIAALSRWQAHVAALVLDAPAAEVAVSRRRA